MMASIRKCTSQRKTVENATLPPNEKCNHIDGVHECNITDKKLLNVIAPLLVEIGRKKNEDLMEFLESTAVETAVISGTLIY